ncbi:MAG TPA: nickel pincer cofactor biosynthesis protein LarB [bacterium]|nr:nickel pincer cofactor biosynthesis protein LarB [bacterium]HOL48298.1 nickel pincer cofactor biosynthesis protein LarB [bacterium]HPQ19798.1 nickel pincer cofactor biosynthesis protein LarB [bacterium]
MDISYLKKILTDYKKNKISLNECLNNLKQLPFTDLNFVKLDNHRSIRKGSAEVIYCKNKNFEQIKRIIEELIKYNNNILLTRVRRSIAKKIIAEYPIVKYNERASTIRFCLKKIKFKKVKVLIITAGTSDICVAEEAGETLIHFGIKPEYIFDIGVAGIHRLFPYLNKIQKADIIIVIAGMEGALPSVIGGIVSAPVIAVPVDTGYGSNFNGLTPLLAMLNSCASNIAVVNINNGFGAAYFAAMICNKICK